MSDIREPGRIAVLVEQARSDALREAAATVRDYATDTHKHAGINECWPERGDRCDITAALKVAAARILDLIDT